MREKSRVRKEAAREELESEEASGVE